MALDVFVCGQASGDTDTLVIPIDVDVPRSDPVNGATLILLYFNGAADVAGVLGASDDATPEDDYSFCLFGDGLNHYGASTFPMIGLAANTLQAGIHSITVNLISPANWGQVVAVAATGVALSAGGVAPEFPDDLAGIVGVFPGTEQPVGGGGSFSAHGIAWDYFTGGGPVPTHIIAPAGAADEDWDWLAGELAIYALRAGGSSDLLGWTWADAAITDFFQLNDGPGGFDGFPTIVLGISPVVPGVAGPSLQGAWGNGDTGRGNGQAEALVSGLGPPPCTPVSPSFGNPTFNRVIPV